MEQGWTKWLKEYGVDYTQGGGTDFAELVLRLVNGWRWKGELPPMGEVVRTMAKERGCTTQQLYSEMKAAVKPLLSALAAEGVPPDRLKTTVLAAAIAEKETERLQGIAAAKPQKRPPVRRGSKRKEGGKYTVKWQGK